MVPARSRQAVVVVAPTWADRTATLLRYERTSRSGWSPVGRGVPAVLGRGGLGWGMGLHGARRGRAKREGDDRSPAGVFRIPSAFGRRPPAGATLPFVRVHAHHRWVDDPRSRHYNRLVDDRGVERDWSSAEVLARPDGLYDATLVVDHNPSRQPGAGSAVFVHAWRAPGRPTAGCTALAPDEVRALLAWLVPDAMPVLVQLPRATYRRVQAAWRLPPLA